MRAFFAERGVLEVETPLLAAAPASDPHLQSIAAELEIAGETRRRYLQTSPEYAMKRLLAAGSGPIYQLARAVRASERGRRHNPEFTLLEWYRPGWDHHALIEEVDDLLRATLATPAGLRLTYRTLFEQYLGIDPHDAPVEVLARRAREGGIDVVGLDDRAGGDRDAWLQLLLSHLIEPELGRDADGARRPLFVYDFPASQAALARIRPGTPPVAERFEVWVAGVELANGYHELIDAAEQRRRFEADLEARRAAGKPAVPLDERLLAALEAGLPPCAGVALGIDRLAMLRAAASSIDEVIAFPIERA